MDTAKTSQVNEKAKKALEDIKCIVARRDGDLPTAIEDVLFNYERFVAMVEATKE